MLRRVSEGEVERDEKWEVGWHIVSRRVQYRQAEFVTQGPAETQLYRNQVHVCLKDKLFPCLINYHFMKKYQRMDVYLDTFLT
jgi:hypothetical protein